MVVRGSVIRSCIVWLAGEAASCPGGSSAYCRVRGCHLPLRLEGDIARINMLWDQMRVIKTYIFSCSWFFFPFQLARYTFYFPAPDFPESYVFRPATVCLFGSHQDFGKLSHFRKMNSVQFKAYKQLRSPIWLFDDDITYSLNKQRWWTYTQ